MLKTDFSYEELRNFEVKTLVVSSASLKGNPLKDSFKRYNQVLVPKTKKTNLPVVFILSGFAGNGSKYFNVRFHEQNFPQLIDKQVSQKLAPKALYVFVDALTFWGGAQFVNSVGTGNYEDYLIEDLLPEVQNNFSVSSQAKHYCVMGGSSGGYGALHLASKYPRCFGTFAATAPDSFFQMSLLPEIYTALPLLHKYKGNLTLIKEDLIEERFFRGKNAFSLLNAIGMGVCYAPSLKRKNKVLWPVNYETGELDSAIWEQWLAFDPVNFLPQRWQNLKLIKNKYLDVGVYDQYYLQYGSRMIKNTFKDHKISLKYEEFEGNHNDISKRRPQVLEWLNRVWK
ncbi:MAG: enterochelin esterase [Bdellovibrionaceae bacterium]|jgi:enterochelin esterase-like enzyme|nr:enterochelin esterase [Pseudobdellovibrionaceae bacterium]